MLVNQREWSGFFEKGAYSIQFLMGLRVLSLSVLHVKCLRRLVTRQQKLLNLTKKKLRLALEHLLITMNVKLNPMTLGGCRIAACEGFFHFSLTFKMRNDFYSSLLRKLVINVYFYPSFIASLIQLKWFGGRLSGVSK